MALTLQQQIQKAFQESHNILITFKKDYNADSIASALALKLLLEKLGKHADIVSDNFTLPSQYVFLPEASCINGTLEGLKQFKICLDIKDIPVKDLSYNMEGDKLNIVITPKKGAYKKDHISTHEGQYAYDLIITVDSEDLESIGTIYQEHQDFFYTTTIINFDHKPENEEYGQINNVDPNVTSTAELVYHTITELYEKELSEDIAQCLLTGIIAKTKSFKSTKVTPQTLHIASRLMKYGADRDSIIKHLYYTKSISTLKLWGKVLSRLSAESKSEIAWSYLTQSDFDEVKTYPDKVHEVIEELILTAPEAKLILIVYEYKKQLHAVLYSDTSLSSKDIARDYEPFGSKRMATFKVQGDNPEIAAKLLVNDIKAKIK